MKSPTIHALCLAAGLAVISSSAQAQSAGSLSVKLGVNTIRPQVSSGDLSAPSLAHTQIDVKSATSLILTATYMLSDAFSVEACAGLPYKHDVVGAGAIAGAGKIGTVKQVSPTLFGQYRLFGASDALRPYAGLGLTYAYFYGERGSGTLTTLTNPGGSPTRLSVDDAWGLSPQIGVNYKFSPQWSLDAAVIKSFIKTTTTLSTGQTIDAKLDPLSINLSVAFRY